MAEYDPLAQLGQEHEADNAEADAEQLPVEEEEEDDDYDPSNLHFQMDEPAPAAADGNTGSSTTADQADATGSAEPTQSPKPAPKKRKVGGFIDEDDDEDTPMVTVTGQDNVAAESAADVQRSVTQTPVNATTLPAQDTSSIDKDAQDHGSFGVTAVSNDPAQTNGAATNVLSNIGLTPSQTPQLPLASSSTVPLPKARLPQDRVGILEDRITADPRGDTDAWLNLIEEYKQRNKIEEVYATYERFLTIFPQAGDQWAAYIQTMMQNEDTKKAESLFGRILLKVPHVRCWSLYIEYIRRMNNLATDTSGTARNVINAAFEFTLKHIGQDPSSGPLWQEYVNFIKTMPGDITKEGWQDKQKVDAMRKAYRQALCIPLPNIQQLWGEYTNFEITASRINGRKFQNEQMPAYMTAKQAYIALENKIQYLDRSTVPKFPPLPGFAGYEEYHAQVKIWRGWIEWEKEDPLVLKDEKQADAFKKRVLFIYQLALMSLRFDAQLWYDAAQYCFDNDLKDEGDKLLNDGIDANPESCLLAFTKADRIETQTVSESDPVARGLSVRAPYNKIIDALYELHKQSKDRFDREISETQERYAQEAQNEMGGQGNGSDDEEEQGPDDAAKKEMLERQQAEVNAIKEKSEAQLLELKKLLTAVWVALIRAMRRVQGKGKPNADAPGSRGVLSEARKRGNVTSDLYIQCALTEWYCYKDPSCLRLFEKGTMLYPNDENFALEYIKHLINVSDLTNARTVFEKTVSRLEKDEKTVQKTKPLYYFFHTFESKYGELAQIQKLEQRIRTLFPEDPMLRIFAHRFEYDNALSQKFEPTRFQPIISPNTQTKEAPGGATVIPSIEVMPGIAFNNSPKRPFDSMSGMGLDAGAPPRKMARGESPLKGAAGRRLQQQARGGTPNLAPSVAGWPIPPQLNFLLAVLPNARLTNGLTPRLIPEGLVNVLRNVQLGTSQTWALANLKNAGRGLMDPVYHQPPPSAGHHAAPMTLPPNVSRPPPPQVSYPPPVSTPTYHHSLPPQMGPQVPPYGQPPPAQYGVYQGPPPPQPPPHVNGMYNPFPSRNSPKPTGGVADFARLWQPQGDGGGHDRKASGGGGTGYRYAPY